MLKRGGEPHKEVWGEVIGEWNKDDALQIDFDRKDTFDSVPKKK